MKVIWTNVGLICEGCQKNATLSGYDTRCLNSTCPNYGQRFAPPTFDLAPLPTPYLTGQQLYEQWVSVHSVLSRYDNGWPNLGMETRAAWNALADRLKVKL